MEAMIDLAHSGDVSAMFNIGLAFAQVEGNRLLLSLNDECKH
jgi:hypothetical protein